MREDVSRTKLSQEHWAKLKSIFEGALRRPEPAREEYVRAACGSDLSLRAEVLHLLQSHAESADILDDASNTTSTTNWGAPVDRTSDRGDARAGTVLNNRYRVKRRLGAGGIGVVYLAEDLNLLGRPVVVKFLHDYGPPDPARLRKFRQEIEALARIDHPGVVAAFDAGETGDGTPFLVMQYVEGETLRNVLESGPMESTRAASVLRQLGEALQAAHDKRIIHRDLKPENIMLHQVANRDVVKLIDFGIARVEESRAGDDTAILSVAGTPSYMAPEQLSGRPELASDMFTLGVIAYEMLAGKRPFPSKHPYQLRQQHKAGLPKGILRRLRPDVPSSVEGLIRRAVAFEPSARPFSAKDWCDSVAEAIADRPVRVTRRSLMLVPAATGVLAAAGAGVWYYRRSAKPARGPVFAEHRGGFDPLTEGFQLQGAVQGSAVRNRERTGFDRWRIQSTDQGSYYSLLSLEEKQEAIRRGWKMTLDAWPEIGGVFAVIDFQGIGQRFDLSLDREVDGSLYVVNCTQHVPTFDGPRHQLTEGSHRLELVYDPVNAACSMDVDGVRLVTGYKGHQQQQSGRGFFFGVSLWKSERADATFSEAKFELL